MTPERCLAIFLASPLGKFHSWRTPDGTCPQAQFLRGFGTHRRLVFRSGNRVGKLQPVDEPVLTPTGWKPIGELRVGDRVIAMDGQPTLVTGVFPQGETENYEVRFCDNTSTRCGLDHLWRVLTRKGRFPRPGHEPEDWQVMSLGEIIQRWGLRPKPVSRVATPYPSPVEFDAQLIPVDPYILGALIGDGCLRTGVRFSTADPEMLEWFREAGHECRHVNNYDYALLGLVPDLRALGLMGKGSWNKRIPRPYLFNTAAIRLEMLRGLMDTDGTVTATGSTSFSTVSSGLADDVVFLVRSLGGWAKVSERTTHYTYRGVRKQGRRSYRVRIHLRERLFRLERKQRRQIPNHLRAHRRLIQEVVPAGKHPSVCISVGHPTGTYITKDFVVTHNTTIGAAAANLLACGFHPWAKCRGPTHGWISTLSWDFCAEVIWPKVKELLPMSLVSSISYRRKQPPEIPNQVLMADGSTITFKSAEQKREKYQGARLDWAWVDEEHPADIVEELRARLIDRGGYLFVTLTPVMRARWVSMLEREEDTKGNLTTLVVRASMLDAARAGILDLQEVLSYERSLPDRQKRVRIHGDLVALEGVVYPDFSRETHCAQPVGDRLVCGEVSWPWPLPDSWPRWSAIDFGFNVATAIPLAVRDPFHNRLIVTQLLYAPRIRATAWADHIHRLMPPKSLKHPPFADHDSFARAELEHEGIITSPADKEREAGIEAVERMLLPCGDGAPGLVLVIDESLHDNDLGRIDANKLAWEFEGYHYAAQKEDRPDVRDEPVKKDDHALDAVRYMIKGWESHVGGPPQPPCIGSPPPREQTALTLAWPNDDDDGDSW